MGRGLLPKGHLVTTAKSTGRALAAMQMGTLTVQTGFPLLILVLFYIIGAPLFTRINLGRLYFRLIFEPYLRQPSAPEFS